MSAIAHSVWSAQDTNPFEIDLALRRLLVQRHIESAGYVPARVLNMVCIVDRQWSGEITNRLRGVGRYHPSRSVICAVEPGRTKIEATATVSADAKPAEGVFGLLRERIVINIGPSHLSHLDTIIDPLVVTDLATLVWAPHGHDEAVDTLLKLAQVVLLDLSDEPEPAAAMRRACALSRRVYVVDLAWLRSTPWRERIADTFEPPRMRARLGEIAGVSIRHHRASSAAGLLLSGWLASRLHWTPAQLARSEDGLDGSVRSERGDVRVTLAPVDQAVPGLAGITIEFADATTLSLDRWAGGLRATSTDPAGRATSWTIVGASRGEAGILGEGMRQALLRDPTYRPALAAAAALAA
jgi:glucose-6-phosphate dehydrogenase assembly protein OpcA